MGKIFFLICFALFVFCALAWDSDIKPRIFTKPNEVHLRPEFKVRFWFILGFLAVFTVLYLILQNIGPDSSLYRMAVCNFCLFLAIFIGNYCAKLTLRKIFLKTAFSLNMDPEEYARSISPDFVVSYIDSHRSDKAALKRQIKYFKSRHHITEACAWVFFGVYCD